MPSSPPVGLSWGDAPSATRCSTTTSIGRRDGLGTDLARHPHHGLGWWLFFDDVHSETFPRLPGLGNRQDTIERWEQGTGLSADGVEWYEILAAVRLATFVIRSMVLLGVTEPNDWIPFTRLAYDRLGWSR